jgi:ribonuclease D
MQTALPNPTLHIQLCQEDLPAGLTFPNGMVAIDTETTGLSLVTDRLCLAQVGDGEGNVWLVKFGPQSSYAAPNLKAVLTNPRLTKLFHYARFDLAMLQKWLQLPPIQPFFCTKIASKLARQQATKHNLRALCQEYLGVELDKTEQMSNWAAPELTASQQLYAAQDVAFLHGLYQHLSTALTEQNLNHAMLEALAFLPTRVELDLRSFPEIDLFAHH